MIPNQDLTPYPEFGNNSTKVKPDDPKYSAGFQPADVLPAEWLNWFLSRASKGVTELGEGVSSMEQEINKVLEAGNQVPEATETNQLITAINYIINQVRLNEQQRPAVGVPTLWMGPKPDWALDFGNGAETKYLWANYPKLNNQKFWDILSTLSSAGWMPAHDISGFYVPDLRGIVPIGYGTNNVRTGEPTGGGNLGVYWGSQNKYHRHNFEHYHNRGGMDIVGTVSNLRVTAGNVSSTSGVFTFLNQTTYPNATAQRSDYTYWTDLKMQASWNWTGVTSKGRNAANTADVVLTGYDGSDQWTQAKPPTIACMWIVRFE